MSNLGATIRSTNLSGSVSGGCVILRSPVTSVFLVDVEAVVRLACFLGIGFLVARYVAWIRWFVLLDRILSVEHYFP